MELFILMRFECTETWAAQVAQQKEIVQPCIRA